METQNVVMAVGSSGCGKSTSIHYVALQLYHHQGYDILPVYSPEEVRQYYDPECKQVFVVDDICGKCSIDLNLVNCWGRQLTEIQKMLKDQRVKILSSCRTHIFQNRLFKNLSPLFFKSCDLTSDFKLDCKERKDIASIYLTTDDMKSLEVTFGFESRQQTILFQTPIQHFDFFPLLCSVYPMQKSCNVRHFFNNPIRVVRDDLTNLMNAYDQKTIATLMLFTVYNNTIDETLLSRTSSLNQVLETISDNFHLQQNFSIHCVKSELNDLNRCYVKKIGCSNFKIIHDKIYEILVLVLGEHKFDVLLNLAHTNIIRDMFLLTSSHKTKQISEDHIEGFVEVSKENEPDYFNRLRRDINDGFVENVLNNKQMKYSSFRRKLIKIIKSESNIKSALENLYKHDKGAVSSLFLVMIRLGFTEMVEILIDYVDLNNDDEDRFYPKIIKGCATNIMKLSSNHDIDPGTTFSVTPGIEKSPLFVASENGYTEIVKLLLEHGSDPSMDVWKRTQNTPLYVASQKGYIGVVKLLLFHKADPNLNISMLVTDGFRIGMIGRPLTHSKDNESPLCAAINNEHSEVVNILLDNGANVNFHGWDGTPLYLAVKKRNLEIVKSLLIHKADPTDSCDFNKPTLYIASENGDIEIVKLLLKYKGNPNIHFHYNKMSPLHMAIQNDHLEIAFLLISHDANPYALDINNKTPMFIALDHGNIDAFRLLAATKKTVTLDTKYMLSTILYFASRYGASVIVKSMLEQTNVDVDDNSHNEYKSTPLGVASLLGNTELVTILLDYKCDPNITSMYEEAILYDASVFIEILCEEFVSRNIFQTHNLTPVYIASRFGHSETVKLLIEKNCNLNITDKGSQKYMCEEPILYVAALNGHAKVVQLLLENGCNPNVCNKFNTTPLHEASCQGHFETVKVLLENNSDPCIINKENDSPLFETAEGRRKIVQVGLKFIFEFERFVSMYKKTPLCIATYLGHTNIVELLNNIDTKTEILYLRQTSSLTLE